MENSKNIEELLAALRDLANELSAINHTVPESERTLRKQGEVVPFTGNNSRQIGPTSGTGRAPNLKLPDPYLVRHVINARRLRGNFFDQEILSETAWDMLLDLAVSTTEYWRTSVTSLCIASGAPTSTALRWIKVLDEQGLIQRLDDPHDRRRSFIELTPKGKMAVAGYFAALAETMHVRRRA